MSRWAYQYQRIADVLQQRADRLASAETPAERRRREQKARLDAHIKRVVDAAPPLTPEQRDRLRLIFQSASREVKA